MILTCPNCATQYVVKDGAIPPQGRQVRCANCKHSWHQDPETVAEAESTAEEPETLTEAMVIEPRSGPEAEERAYEEAMLEPEPDEAGRQELQPHLEQPEEGADLAAEERARDVSADFDMAERSKRRSDRRLERADRCGSARMTNSAPSRPPTRSSRAAAAQF